MASRDHVVSARVSDVTLREFESYAKSVGTSVSGLLNQLVIATAKLRSPKCAVDHVARRGAARALGRVAGSAVEAFVLSEDQRRKAEAMTPAQRERFVAMLASRGQR